MLGPPLELWYRRSSQSESTRKRLVPKRTPETLLIEMITVTKWASHFYPEMNDALSRVPIYLAAAACLFSCILNLSRRSYDINRPHVISS
ncbi:hypothetical protein AcW1_002007 [Taiwanofungus camphoratus]|nr:hypothetical protein AcW1_002007 [Antrodia cinnamomea]KAI0945894.1 hypothetical protein AcV7_010012 [Antrodia cinnamomea]